MRNRLLHKQRFFILTLPQNEKVTYSKIYDGSEFFGKFFKFVFNTQKLAVRRVCDS